MLRGWTSPGLQERPCPWRPPRLVLHGPLREGGSRRSLLPPPWPVGRRERSANPLVRAPPLGERLAGYASLLVAPALRARARSSPVGGAAATRLIYRSRPTLP